MIACALALLATLLAQDTRPIKAASTGITWAESYEKAFEEANERGVPVLIAVIQDGEEANEDIWSNMMHDPKFVAATKRTVNLIANRGADKDHGEVEVKRAGRTAKVCGKFGGIPCIAHRRAEIGVFRDFARDGMLKTPMLIWSLPDQTIVAQLIDRHPLGDFLLAFEAAAKKSPNGLDEDEVDAVRAGLESAKTLRAAGETAKVVAFALPFAKRESQSRLIQQVQKLLTELEEAGKQEMAEVDALIAAKDYPKALDRYAAIAESYKGSMVERIARERLKDLNANPEVKAALKRLKAEDSARKLLERADALAAKGEAEKAKKLYDQLLKSFATTKAAEEYQARGK